MATIDWPVSLPPALPVESLERADEDNVVETPMAGGISKRRRLFSAVSQTIVADPQRFILNRVQKERLMDFYDTDTASGTLRFNWLAPIKGLSGPVEVRFVGRPQTQLVASGRELYRVRAAFEIMP